MAKIIAIMNEKGGCAKTTTATALAYLLAKQGKKTALIDFDGQANSTLLMGVENPNAIGITISTLLGKVILEEQLPDPEEYLIHTGSGVDLIPSNSQLFALERNLISIDYREYILSNYVNSIRKQYEYIIIDCMPQIGTPMVNVMTCADSLIIPTQAEILSAQGLQEIIKHYVKSRRSGNTMLKIEGILITMNDARTKTSKIMNEMICDTFGNSLRIFNTRIPYAAKVKEAAYYGKTVCEYRPSSPAAKAYTEFVKEVLNDA